MAGMLAGKRILVAEDEYFIAADLRVALANEGAEVVGPVGSLERGLDLAELDALDAAVLDVNLAGECSLAIVDRLRAEGVPFVLVTGYDGWSLPEEYRDAPRFAKPFRMPNVIDCVAALIDQA